MDFPGRLMAGFMAVVLILVFPLQYIAQLSGENTDALVDERTHRFTDEIRKKGYLNRQMYEEYIKFLDVTGDRYSIEIQDIKPVKGEDISYNKRNEYKSSLVQVSHENIIQSFAAHTHTDDCYAGHRHTEKCYSMPIVFEETSQISNLSSYRSITFYCGYCHERIVNYYYDSRQGYNRLTVKVYQPSYTAYTYTQYTNAEYDSITKIIDELMSKFYSYITYKEITSGNGTYIKNYGYVPPEKTYEFPVYGNFNSCSKCTGKEIKTIKVYKYYNQNYLTGYVDLTCLLCNRKIAQISWTYNSYYHENHYSLNIYDKNGNIIYSNGKTDEVYPIWAEIEKYQSSYNTEKYYDYRHDIFQFDILNPAIYHGCKYPDAKCQLHEDTNPICDRVVVSIKATNPTQTIVQGGAVITTATAIYLDGHTGTVNCTAGNFNPNLSGTQTVTLSYTGLIKNAKTTGTITCTITVTVKANKTLTSITVSPATQTIQKYSNPSFTVKAIYSDSSNKNLSPGQYTVSGLNVSTTGTQNVTISYTENSITKSATVKVTVTPLKRECLRCHNVYELNSDDTDPGCPYCKNIIVGIEVSPDYVEITQGEQLPIEVVAIYNNDLRSIVNDWTSDFKPEKAGLQIVTVEYAGYAREITVWVKEKLIICPVCHTEYPASMEDCPVCSENVVSISVEPQEITVNQFDAILLTVTAHYANGESRIVDDWSIDKDTLTPGTYIATVSYKGVTATVKLNVLSVYLIQCPICGLLYDLSQSPKGCPVCSEKPAGIEVYLKSGSNLVQYGSTPDIAVVLIFLDEHREFAYEGYTLEGFDPYQLGEQTVKVIYEDFYDTVILNVVNILDAVICPNGHVYYRNADGTDSGCPFCNMTTGEDSETKKITYFDITYTSEIIDTIYTAGKYYFQENNYISVIVIKKDMSLLYEIQKKIVGTSLFGRKKRFIYGGVVQSQ